MAIRLHNTLSHHVEEFVPHKDAGVRMFVCGPTVYDYIHIGNARPFVFFDVVAKYLRHRGYEVFYLQNITDIDDKIINRAREQQRSAHDYAQEYSGHFFEDVKRLKVSGVTTYAKASEHINEILAQVTTLIEKNYAYAVPPMKAEGTDAVSDDNRDVYFDITAYERDFPGQYGTLSGQKFNELEEGVRVVMEANKKNPRDFVLWKAQNYTYEPAWQSPWGMGRPGWHIEDTAISEKYLGQQYDLHGGGQDLIFPHHEAEIAQQQAASGKTPFVRYWMHNGFLEMGKEKMSKSLGNFATVHDLLQKYAPEVLRLYLLSAHYRSPLGFSDASLIQAEAGIARIAEFIDRLVLFDDKELVPAATDDEVTSQAKQFSQDILEALDDDFNTPRAIGILFDFIRAMNQRLDAGQIDRDTTRHVLEVLDVADHVLGIVPRRAAATKLSDDVVDLMNRRQKARDAGDFAEADKLRAKIIGLGYSIDDTPYGPLVKKK